MQLARTPEAFRAAAEELRATGRLGFVPTMGALHEGHRALMRAARERAAHVAVSIFVNPTQFGPTEDLSRYPRPLEADLAACEAEGVSLVFLPEVEHLYPAGEQTRVSVARLTEGLCGASRPTHFQGVATVVTKLLALTGPCVAVFGRKDYQQWQVVRRLTADLCLPVEVVGAPTVRQPDGLALSSRNQYLSAEERQRALAIPRALTEAARAFAAGERHAAALEALARTALEQAALRVDYVSVAHPETLARVEGRTEARALLALAAFAGTTRLIDNLVLGEEPAPLPRAP